MRWIFAARILWNPSSRVDMRMWVLNGLALASGYGFLAVGNVFCKDAVVGGADARVRAASSDRLAGVDGAGDGDAVRIARL